MATRRPNNQRRKETLSVETIQLSCTGCSPDILNDTNVIRRMLKRISGLADLTPIYCRIHPFPKQGLTGYIILAESHIAIHTWPEYEFAVLDIQTCNPGIKFQETIPHVKKTLGAKKIKLNHTKLLKRF